MIIWCLHINNDTLFVQSSLKLETASFYSAINLSLYIDMNNCCAFVYYNACYNT